MDNQSSKQKSKSQDRLDLWRVFQNTPVYILEQTPPFSKILRFVYVATMLVGLLLIALALLGLLVTCVGGTFDTPDATVGHRGYWGFIVLGVGFAVSSGGNRLNESARAIKRTRVTQDVVVYLYPDEKSSSVAKFEKWELVNLIPGDRIKKKGKVWMGVTTPDGNQGYISENTKMVIFRVGKVLSKSVEVHKEIDEGSTVVGTLSSGDEVEIGTVWQKQEKRWLEVIIPNGLQGFINGDTSILYNFVV